jgi:hypothetical protein
MRDILRSRVVRRLETDSAQDAIEYLIITGAFVVVLVIAMLAFDNVVVSVLDHVCPSVDTANPAVAIGSCIGLS